jgi:hypothetical protein
MLLSGWWRDDTLRANLRNMRYISLNGASGDPRNRKLESIACNDPIPPPKFELKLI